MEKKSLKKILLSAGLVGVIGVGASLAYFSDVTMVLTNTFDMFGDSTNPAVALTIKENGVTVDKNGNYVLDDDVWKIEGQGNEYKDFLPGATLAKNPTVFIGPKTTDSVVVVKATGLDQSEVFETIQIDTNNWNEITDDLNLNDGARYFEYHTTVSNPKATEVSLESLFTSITVKSGVSSDKVIKNIEIKAAAVQTAHVEDPVNEAVGLLNTNQG